MRALLERQTTFTEPQSPVKEKTDVRGVGDNQIPLRLGEELQNVEPGFKHGIEHNIREHARSGKVPIKDAELTCKNLPKNARGFEPRQFRQNQETFGQAVFRSRAGLRIREAAE